MPSNVAVTKAMLKYAKEHKLDAGNPSTTNPLWGTGKARLAWRVSGHMRKHGKKITQSARKTNQLVAALFPDLLPKLDILYPNYKWNGAPVVRRGSPPGIVWHHSVGFGSPEFIHKIHLNIGDRGIAYHFYIRRDGKVYAGRPEPTMGAHCLGHNDCLGACLEGNYEAHDDMPRVQTQAAKALHRHLHQKYGGIPDWQHKNMSGNSTACPGRYFGFAKITA